MKGRTAAYRWMRHTLLLALLGLAASATPGSSQVLGRVIDQASRTGVPTAGVALVDSTGAVMGQVVSDANGRFIVPIGRPGTYSVQVVALGYVATPIDNLVYTGERTFLEVTVAPAPIETEGLEVVVEQQEVHLVEAGFYQRRRLSGGQFIGPEEIVALRATRSAHLMRRMSSVSIVEGREPVFNRTQGANPEGGTCLPNVWIDGMPIRTVNFQDRSNLQVGLGTNNATGGNAASERLRSFGERFDLIAPPPEQIAAIEAYPGGATVPAQWRTSSSGCGVIVVWTRRR